MGTLFPVRLDQVGVAGLPARRGLKLARAVQMRLILAGHHLAWVTFPPKISF
jgi:hypothetical protein